MKVASIRIQNFKQFDDLEISFKNEILDEVSDRYLILGDNGSGKTTLLQAIALPLALATGRIREVSDFDWLGFLPGRYWQSGTPRIELEIAFETEELEKTREIYELWYDDQPLQFRTRNEFVKPGDSKAVKVLLEGDYLQVGSTEEEGNQFRGRYYTQWFINKGEQYFRRYFPQLPSVFWFDQFRNLGNKSNSDRGANGRKERQGELAFDVGVGQLRSYLIEWYYRQERSDDANNYLPKLEQLYQVIFPERSFYGIEHLPRPGSPTDEDTYFLLNDSNKTYDITEMSAGEQSVFPILYEVVRQQIAHSVVLIDEIDLNLHPPAAQYFASQLLRLEPTCQFIFTTHSADVSNVIREHETYRIKGGSLCL